MAKKYEVVVTPSAQRDLTEIKSYFTNILKTASNSVFEKKTSAGICSHRRKSFLFYCLYIPANYFYRWSTRSRISWVRPWFQNWVPM